MKPQLSILLFIYLSFFYQKMHAESRATSNELRSALGSNYIKAEAEFSYYSFLRSDVEYFGKDENSAALTTAGLGFNSSHSRLHMDGHWFFVPQEDFHYINLPEASFEVRGSDSKFYIGRHLHRWSEADEFWQTGIWQPRFMWNYLKPEQNGFTGVFYSSQISKDTSFSLFLSSLFIPDLGPKYREEDGKIITKNPWIKSPPALVNLFDNDTPIIASVDEPEVREVVLKPSFAIQFRKKWSEVASSQVAYAYKPVNFVRLSYAYYLRAQDSANEAVVTAHPSFPYEQVITTESSFSKNGFIFTPSLTHQDPNLEGMPFQNISQDIQPMTTGSLTFSKEIDPNGKKAGSIYFGIMKTWEKTPKDIGENAPVESVFGRRTSLYMAYRAGIEAFIYRYKSRPISSRVEATYDSDQEVGVFSTEMTIEPYKNLNLNFALNLLGATTSRETEFEKGMIRTYRANDNINLGLSYAY